MATGSKSKLSELQATISKMSLQACCVAVLPELGLRWSEVSRAIRSSKLAMTPASAARVLCRHIARSLPAEEYDDLLNRLRLKLKEDIVRKPAYTEQKFKSVCVVPNLHWASVGTTAHSRGRRPVPSSGTCIVVATQKRVWHLVSLSEPVSEEPVSVAALTARVRQALRRYKAPKNMTAVVESVNIGDLVYFSVQLVSASRQGSALYCAVPPGNPVALLSSLGAKTLLKAVIEGVGYKVYTDESLHGRDIPSLLRIHARQFCGDHAQAFEGLPEYRPAPAITENGIDFTNKAYNEEYMDMVIGPNPPLLTDLKIQTSDPFYDPTRLRKNINLTIDLKSTDIASTLKEWVKIGALGPTSPLVQIFQEMHNNSISCKLNDD